MGALRDLLDYTAWASTRLVAAAAMLGEEEINRDFGTADKSVLGTLVHTFGGDRVWITRVEGQTPAYFIRDEDRSVAALQTQWPEVHERWRRWIAQQDDGTVAEPIAYSDMRGNAYQQPPWQIVLHVVNHGTHHRGQTVGFLRSMGIAPPPVDMTVYYRTRGRS